MIRRLIFGFVVWLGLISLGGCNLDKGCIWPCPELLPSPLERNLTFNLLVIDKMTNQPIKDATISSKLWFYGINGDVCDNDKAGCPDDEFQKNVNYLTTNSSGRASFNLTLNYRYVVDGYLIYLKVNKAAYSVHNAEMGAIWYYSKIKDEYVISLIPATNYP